MFSFKKPEVAALLQSPNSCGKDGRVKDVESQFLPSEFGSVTQDIPGLRERRTPTNKYSATSKCRENICKSLVSRTGNALGISHLGSEIPTG